MNGGDIILMAREANRYANSQTSDSYEWQEIRDERFAALVAAAEREACAQVAERFEPDEKTSYVTYASTAIRARGNNT